MKVKNDCVSDSLGMALHHYYRRERVVVTNDNGNVAYDDPQEKENAQS